MGKSVCEYHCVPRGFAPNNLCKFNGAKQITLLTYLFSAVRITEQGGQLRFLHSVYVSPQYLD